METKHKAKRQAIDVMLGGTLMWRQVALRKRRIQAATTISAAWRSYCVRVNLKLKHDAARRIQRTRRALSVMLDTQDMVVEILVVAKFMREMHLERQTLVIQRCFRKWQRKEVPPMRRVRRAIVV